MAAGSVDSGALAIPSPPKVGFETRPYGEVEVRWDAGGYCEASRCTWLGTSSGATWFTLTPYRGTGQALQSLSHRGRGGRPVPTEHIGNNKIGRMGFRGNLTRIGVRDMDWRGRRSDLVAAFGGDGAEAGVYVQPDCTTSELLGDGAGGAGAEEWIKDGIAGEAEQLYEPAGQLLWEGGRMPELGPGSRRGSPRDRGPSP